MQGTGFVYDCGAAAESERPLTEALAKERRAASAFIGACESGVLARPFFRFCQIKDIVFFCGENNKINSRSALNYKRCYPFAFTF